VACVDFSSFSTSFDSADWWNMPCVLCHNGMMVVVMMVLMVVVVMVIIAIVMLMMTILFSENSV